MMVLIAGLEGRLLTSLRFIMARPTSQCNTNVKFQSNLSIFVLFLVDSFFLICEQPYGEQFEESVLNLQICWTKGLIIKKCSSNEGFRGVHVGPNLVGLYSVMFSFERLAPRQRERLGPRASVI